MISLLLLAMVRTQVPIPDFPDAPPSVLHVYDTQDYWTVFRGPHGCAAVREIRGAYVSATANTRSTMLQFSVFTGSWTAIENGRNYPTTVSFSADDTAYDVGMAHGISYFENGGSLNFVMQAVDASRAYRASSDRRPGSRTMTITADGLIPNVMTIDGFDTALIMLANCNGNNALEDEAVPEPDDANPLSLPGTPPPQRPRPNGEIDG